MSQNHDWKNKVDPQLLIATLKFDTQPSASVAGSAGRTVTAPRVAEAVDPAVEDAYWSEHYRHSHYVERSRPYMDYRSAYRYGWESRALMGGRAYSEIEGDLERGWNMAKGDSALDWTQARDAIRDAWQRHDNSSPGCKACA